MGQAHSSGAVRYTICGTTVCGYDSEGFEVAHGELSTPVVQGDLLTVAAELKPTVPPFKYRGQSNTR